MAKDARLELRVEKGLLDAIDAARGDVSRTRWVERALEKALAPPLQGSQQAALDEAMRKKAPSRAPMAREASDYELPKIAPRRKF